MKTYITESDIKNMVSECVRLLTEDAESKNMNRARKYLEANGVETHEERHKIITDVREEVPNARLLNCKFLLGVTRMYFENQLTPKVTAMLNKALEVIVTQGHEGEFDFNLNGETAVSLVNKFKDEIQRLLDADKERADGTKRKRNEDYTIIPINSTREASRYSRYTSWCVTTSQDMYNRYTNEGLGRFYFCLRKGFETETRIHGDGCPLDSYGLSMIAVSINMDGSVNTVTCRWNHDNGGNDHIMTVEQLEDLLGVNFYQTFLPYTKEELHAKGAISFEDIQEMLDKKDPAIWKNVHDYIGDYKIITFQRKRNFINPEGKLMMPIWANATEEEGLMTRQEKTIDRPIVIWVGEKRNFFSLKKGRLIYGNFANIDGWFTYTGVFREVNGVAEVRKNGKSNLLTTVGTFLSDVWFDRIIDVRKTAAVIGIGEHKNIFYFKDKSVLFGSIDNPEAWPRDVSITDNGSIIVVNAEGKQNIYDPEKKRFISEVWADSVYEIGEGHYKVTDRTETENGNYRYVSNIVNGTTGELMYGRSDNPNTWLDLVHKFVDGLCVIKKGGKSNYINRDGKVVFGEKDDPRTWFDHAFNLEDDGQSGSCAAVFKDNMFNIIDNKGRLFFGNPNDTSTWLDDVSYDMINFGVLVVSKNNMFNFMLNKYPGEVLFGEKENIGTWFDNAYYGSHNDTLQALGKTVNGNVEWYTVNNGGLLRKISLYIS